MVVLDICMPGMDGVETLEALLAADPGLPVILNTAYTTYRENFLTWAAADYVVKSADLTELKASIRRVLVSNDQISNPKSQKITNDQFSNSINEDD